jgi:hypothetical protein
VTLAKKPVAPMARSQAADTRPLMLFGCMERLYEFCGQASVLKCTREQNGNLDRRHHACNAWKSVRRHLETARRCTGG